ncbi:hypothetical protein BCAH1134_C0299 (plasmid) [Bacillus cereus AH1134]|nr:hypothetical protein BCAH1134_C0299 [Bacillus cereus AH1134]
MVSSSILNNNLVEKSIKIQATSSKSLKYCPNFMLFYLYI